MAKRKYLHIVGSEMKFIKPFISYTNEHFDEEEHFFLALNSTKEDAKKMTDFKNVFIARPYDWKNDKIRLMMLGIKIPYSILLLLYYVSKVEKVFLHGLFDKKVVLFLSLFKTYLEKTYWIIWGGGDLDVPTEQRKNDFWSKAIRKVKGGFFGYVTYLPGDYEIAKKLYDAKGDFFMSLMYESNIFRQVEACSVDDDVIRIQIGNSADSANNHIEVLEGLSKFRNDNIELYCILSYGEKPWSKGWAKKVTECGKNIFGDKFIPVTDFMTKGEYDKFLSKMDIAIFNHKRQQAMGNTIMLLGLGKKVYMRSDLTSWELFNEIGVKVYDVSSVNIDPIDEGVQRQNSMKVKEYFSKESYLKHLVNLYRD